MSSILLTGHALGPLGLIGSSYALDLAELGHMFWR